MKKTLVTLLAMSAVSNALTFEDANLFVVGNSSIDASSYDTKDMTVALTLNVTKLKSLLTGTSTGYEIVTLKSTSTTDKTLYTGIGVNTKTTDGVSDFGLWGEWVNGNDKRYTYTSADGGVNVFADLNGAAEGTGWDSVAYAGLTYTHKINGQKCSTYLAWTLCDANGEVIASNYQFMDGLGSGSFQGGTFAFGDVVTHTHFFAQAESNEAGMKALSLAAATVPEPTTATLSLLALAGLAARRRRK